MIRNKIVVVFIFLSLLSLSCQEDFSPKTDFKEQYVLSCYIDLDYDQYMNTQVYATVSKLYNVDGFDPSQNKIDPTVAGAEIYLNYRDILYKLQQDTNKTETTKYGTNQIYYTTTLRNIYANYNISVSAKMPDGTMLTAYTQLLEALQLNCSYDFRNNFTTKINKFLWGNALTLSWANYGNRLFCPEMTIEYFIYLGGEGKSLKLQGGSKQIPVTYVNRNGQLEPIYPPNFTSNASISFDYAAIDSAMAQISIGDSDKKNIILIEYIFKWLKWMRRFQIIMKAFTGHRIIIRLV